MQFCEPCNKYVDRYHAKPWTWQHLKDWGFGGPREKRS
jgi:hypothetical protein